MDTALTEDVVKKKRYAPDFPAFKRRSVKTRSPIDENLVLLRAYRNGDTRALNQLIARNEGMIMTIALRFIPHGYSESELLQLGREAYWEAVKRYDERFGTRVNTYATWWIRSFIFRYVKEESKKRRHVSSFDQGTEHTSEENRQFIMSLDNPSCDRRPNPEYICLMRDLIRRTREKIERLSPRECFVLRRTFGFDDREGPWTLQRMGDSLGFTREYIRQVQARALQKIGMTKAAFTHLVKAESTFLGSV